MSLLQIHTAIRSGKTFLKNSFCNQPFKLADVTEGYAMNDLHLIIMSSSPGILDGDEYQINIELDEESRLHLENQSYQRLFQMKTGASQTLQVKMQRGSHLKYLQHPVVPHESSKFVSKNRIYLQNDCSLLWGEVLTSGRKLNGESFIFSSYHNITEIFLNDKLVVKENLLIKPSMLDIQSIGMLEGFTHQATLICLNEHLPVKDLIQMIRKDFDNKEIEFGITELSVNGLIIRMLGNKAEQLFDLNKKFAAVLETYMKPKTINLTDIKYAV
jgi:urease accessory protein